MKLMQLLLIFTIFTSLPLIGSAGAGSSSSSAAAAGMDLKQDADVKANTEHPYTVDTQNRPKSIAFSPNGKFAAVANSALYGESDEPNGSISMYSVDNLTGILTPVQGSPFISPEFPFNVTFSLDSNFLIATHDFHEKRVRKFKHIYSVNQATGELKLMDNSLFLIDGSQAQAYSSNGKWAATCKIATTEIFAYTFDTAIRAFIPAPESPFKTIEGIPNIAEYEYLLESEIKFDPLNAFAAYISHYDETISLYKVNPQTGKFTLATSPLKIKQAHPHNKRDIFGGFLKMAFSPNGAFLAVANEANALINVYKVNRKTGALTEVVNSPFQVAKGGMGSPLLTAIAFSPTNNFAAITDELHQKVLIFEVNQITGAFTPITGNMLQGIRSKEKMKITKKSFQEFSKTKHASESGAAGLGEVPKQVEQLLAEYMSASAEKETAAAPAEPEIIDVKEAHAKREADRQLSGAKLLTAIDQGDNAKIITEYLNPLSIQARDANNNTPLILAARMGRKNIVNALLTYAGQEQASPYHAATTIQIDLTAQNYEKNSALTAAILSGHFDVALAIALEMEKRKPSALCLNNNNKDNAYTIALRNESRNGNNPQFQQLLALLKNHCAIKVPSKQKAPESDEGPAKKKIRPNPEEPNNSKSEKTKMKDE